MAWALLKDYFLHGNSYGIKVLIEAKILIVASRRSLFILSLPSLFYGLFTVDDINEIRYNPHCQKNRRVE